MVSVYTLPQTSSLNHLSSQGAEAVEAGVVVPEGLGEAAPRSGMRDLFVAICSPAKKTFLGFFFVELSASKEES